MRRRGLMAWGETGRDGCMILYDISRVSDRAIVTDTNQGRTPLPLVIHPNQFTSSGTSKRRWPLSIRLSASMASWSCPRPRRLAASIAGVCHASWGCRRPRPLRLVGLPTTSLAAGQKGISVERRGALKGHVNGMLC